MEIICLDFEGVLVPEIWVALADKVGINELKLTTRDIPNYNELMNGRLKILKENDVNASDLFKVAQQIEPFEGSKDFLDSLRKRFQVIILSDTFFNLARPIFYKLGWPTVFCHNLELSDKKFIKDYTIRIEDHKKKAVDCFKKLNYKTIAVGDSFNDLSMLKEADLGILFRAPDNIIKSNKGFFNCNSYSDLKKKIFETANKWV